MITRDTLLEEIKQVPDKFLTELHDFILFLKYKKQKGDDSIITHLLSEEALQDWDTKEEDAAWKHL